MTAAHATNHAVVEAALAILRERRGNLFLTGRAGTGKTTFLERARTELQAEGRCLAVVAPTGIAAVNAHGATIHSFFRIPPRAYHPEGPQLGEDFERCFVPGFERTKVLRQLELLFIDEVSMVRADLLDVIDTILRRVRGSALPFGGVQVCLIGDAFQLAPVVSDREEHVLLEAAYGSNLHFFGSRAFERASFSALELPEVMRQREGGTFVEILNRIRVGEHTAADLIELNERLVPPFALGHLEDEQVLLTATNAEVDVRNESAIQRLLTPLHTFDAVVTGEFPARDFPTDAELRLRVGALVMFVRNDSDAARRYHNGTLAEVTEISETSVTVHTRDGTVVNTVRERWEKIRYLYKPLERTLASEVTGTFTQFPLRLAYAITIHKSQGLTLDGAVVDLKGVFDAGHAYVALSRIRSFSELYLASALVPEQVIVSPAAVTFQRWVDGQKSADGTAFAKPVPTQPTFLVPRFLSPTRPLADGQNGPAIAMAHGTDAGRTRSRAELELELEDMRRQRDELLRVVRKIRKALGED